MNNAAACGTNLDHAVNIVGYGTTGGVNYWLMRNSWGTTWGESGYFQIEQTEGVGICGMNQQLGYPYTVNTWKKFLYYLDMFNYLIDHFIVSDDYNKYSRFLILQLYIYLKLC